MFCQECSEGVDNGGNLSPTYYCGQDCKEKDLAHESVCRGANARKQLFRGGTLLQRIFHELCEATFVLCITDAQVENGKLSFTGEMIGAGKPPFYTHPDHWPEFKNALITWNRCNDGVGFMHELIEKILNGINNPSTMPAELLAIIDPSHQKCRLNRKHKLPKIHQPRDDLHAILSVSLVDGNKYVIDVSGAQYGFEGAVMSQEEYFQYCSIGVHRNLDFGHTYENVFQRILHGELDHELEPWFDTRALIVRDAIATAFTTEVEKIEVESGMRLSKLLNQPQKSFTATAERLIARIKEVIWNTAASTEWDSLPKNDYLERKRSELKEKIGAELTEDQMHEELERVLFEDGIRLKDYKSMAGD